MEAWEWFKRQPTGGKIAVGIAALVVVAIPISAIGAALEGEEEPTQVQRELRAAAANLRQDERAEERQAKAKPPSKPVQQEPELSREGAETEIEEEFTAEFLVDLMEEIEPSNIRKICRTEDSIGEGFALAFFEEGYTTKDPSAEEVFDEIMERC